MGDFQKGTYDDARKAVEAANSAFESWSDNPSPKRAEYLFKVAELLIKHKSELARVVTREMEVAREEIFGPVVCMLSVRDFWDAVDVANSVDYGLSSSIFTSNIRNVFVAINKLQAGLTYVNSSTIGAKIQLHFGGVKKSGNTRGDGPEGVRKFTDLKTVYIDYSGRLQKTFVD